MFDQLKALGKMAGSPSAIRDMIRMQREMKREEVKVEQGDVTIVIGGDMMVKEITVGGEKRKDLKRAYNQAVQKIQQRMAQKMAGG